MQDSSPHNIKHDTTPATFGDLDIWGGRIVEMIDEKAEEVKTELKTEIKELAKRMDASDARQSQTQDTLTDVLLLVKSIDRKLLKK